MPLPNPREGESKSDFISRCVSDDQVREDFDSNDQRVAVCNRIWEREMKTIKLKKENGELKVKKEKKETYSIIHSENETKLIKSPLARQMMQKNDSFSDIGKDKENNDVKIDRVLKEDEENQIVDVVAMEPEKEDADGDIWSKQQVRNSQVFHFKQSQVIGKDHKEVADAELVGSITLPDDVTRWAGKDVQPGSWILSIHIPDKNKWEMAKDELNGVSPGGFIDTS